MNQLLEDTSISKTEIKSFKTIQMLETEINSKSGQNKTRSVVFFEQIDKKFRYHIMYNGTQTASLYEGFLDEPYIVNELQHAIDNAIRLFFSFLKFKFTFMAPKVTN
jgi:hypothetical protein